MKTYFIVQGYMAIAELDNFENGCHGKSQTEFVKAIDWEFKTIDDCVNWLFLINQDKPAARALNKHKGG